MKIVSNGFIAASLAPNGYADANIDINGTVINASNITEISITEDIGDSGAFNIGSFNTTVASMTILTEALPSIVTGVPIEIRYGYFVPSTSPNGHFEWLSMGTFYAEPKDVSRSGLFTTIQAYDRSIKLTDIYSSALDWSTAHTVAEVISEIETTLSIGHRTYDGLPHSTIVYEQPKGTYRDVIMQMAALMGGNVKLDQFGYLKFIRLRFSTAVESYGSYNYQSSEFKLTSDSPANYGKVTVNYKHQTATGEEQTDVYEYTAGSGSNTIVLETVNIRTQAQTNTFGNAVLGSSGFEYYGYTINLPGQPQIDLGDTISIEDMWGTARNFIVMQATHTFNGTMTSTFSATVSDTEPGINDTNINGSVTERVSTMNDAVVYAKAKADEATASAAEAERQAGIATTNANTAITQAGIATTNADEAIRQAGIAKTAADSATSSASAAQTSANNALQSAKEANNSANSALNQLSTVEEVIDTLNWIAEHGTYKKTTDTTVAPGKLYFTRTGSGTSSDPYAYTVVQSPTGNPSTKGYYELDSVDEAISNYVSTHLALTNEGLYVLNDSNGWKVLIKNDGVYIQNPSGTTVATYSSNTIIGSALLKNVLINSNGVYMRDGSTVLASFTGSSAQIGKSSASHSVIDTNGMRIYASNGTTQIANLGYGEANAEGGTIIAPYYTFGTRKGGRFNSYNSSYTYEKGDYCEYGGVKFVCVTKISTPESWNPDHWEKMIGASSSALGQEIIASGWGTTAEGIATVACGHGSHAEGQQTVAASGSHAEGGQSKARGTFSHAQNFGTIADGDHQTAIGQYNIADTTSALIIGNGSSSSRSNALTVDWSGNVNIANGAKYKINGTELSASDVGAPSTGDTAWSHIGSSMDFSYIKRSGFVYLNFYKQSQTLSTSWTTIGTLPKGYRPSHNIYGPAMALTSTRISYFISINGSIQLRASDSGTLSTGFSVTFPADI